MLPPDQTLLVNVLADQPMPRCPRRSPAPARLRCPLEADHAGACPFGTSRAPGRPSKGPTRALSYRVPAERRDEIDAAIRKLLARLGV